MIEQVLRALADILDVVNDWYRAVLFLPEQASQLARRIDALHYVEITCFTVIAVGFMGTTIAFLVRFRRRGEPRRTPAIHAPTLVGLYAGGLLTLFAAFWLFSYPQYVNASSAGRDAIPIYVTGKQWMWQFAYEEGVVSAGVLYLPANRPVRLVLTSRDVIHSFYLPGFRVKQDVVPGAYATLAIEPERPGAYRIFCAELCGVGHSRMRAELVVLEPEAYSAWIDRERRIVATRADGPPSAGTTNLAALGEQFAAQHGCLHCHTIDGRRHIGPTWAGLFGRAEPLQDGTQVIVDPEYITESMMDPRRRVVQGFEPVMPSFQGQITPAETAAIVELMRSLRDVPVRDEQVAVQP